MDTDEIDNNEDIVNEKWKTSKEFEEYQGSTEGQIRNKDTKRILKQQKNAKGYMHIGLINSDGKHKSVSVHQFIAKIWIDNPDNKPTVDHINKIKHDNKVSNLRWATHKEQSENIDYKNKKIGHSKGVWKCDKKTGEKIIFYKTIKEASIDVCGRDDCFSNISACALGKTNHAYGFKWMYNKVTLEDDETWKLFKSFKKHNFYISEKGRIKNNDRIMKPSFNNGYYEIYIDKKYYRMNRLVALLFIANPDNFEIVNHLDGDKKNNEVSNLEWTDHEGNGQHACDTGLRKNVKKVVHYKDTKILGVYNSCTEAGNKLGVNITSVNKCCKGNLRSCGTKKYTFKFLSPTDDVDNDIIDVDTLPERNLKGTKTKSVVRKIDVYNRRTNKFIKTYDTITAVCKKYEVNEKTVKAHCENLVKYPTGDYKFSYADE